MKLKVTPLLLVASFILTPVISIAETVSESKLSESTTNSSSMSSSLPDSMENTLSLSENNIPVEAEIEAENPVENDKNILAEEVTQSSVEAGGVGQQEGIGEEVSREELRTKEEATDESKISPIQQAQTRADTWQNIKTLPNTKTDYSIPLASKYAFMPKPSKQTKVYYENDGGGIGKEIELRPSTITKDKSVVRYDQGYKAVPIRITNIGSYNGQELDIVINIADINLQEFGFLIVKKGAAEIVVSEDRFLTFNLRGKKGSYFHYTMTTVAAGTTTPVKTSGVMVLKNITAKKTVLLGSEDIKELYTPNDSIVNYRRDGLIGGKVAYGFGTDTNDDLDTNLMALVYDNLTTRSIGMRAEADTDLVSMVSITSQFPIAIELPEPWIAGEGIGDFETPSYYHVLQTIPPQPVGSELKNFEMQIPISKALSKVDVTKIVVSNGITKVDPTSLEMHFEEVQDPYQPNILHINAKPAYLAFNEGGNGLYGNDLNISIPVLMNYATSYNSFEDLAENLIKIPATATLVTDAVYGTKTSSESGEVSFTNQGTRTVEYKDEQGREIIPSKVTSNRIKEPYDLSIDVDQGGYQLTSDPELLKGVQAPWPLTVTNSFKDHRFNLKTEFFNTKGELLSTIRPEETIEVKLTLASLIGKKESFLIDQTSNYLTSEISIPYDQHLTEPNNLKIQDKNGVEIGVATYDSTAKKINGKLTEKNLSSLDDYYLTFEITVKKDLPDETLISFQGTSVSTFDKNMLSHTSTSEVAQLKVKSGELKFSSFPQTLNFGSLSFNSMETAYYPTEMEEDLVIQDNRGKQPHWKLFLTLTDEFTGHNSHQIVSNLLHYQKNGKPEALVLAEEMEIAASSERTTAHENITDQWTEHDNGLMIFNRIDGLYADEYEAELTWSLIDAP